ncbi:MAG: hypothetical protein SFY81_16540 [Verrucomicrobiota bacterium]|nr:hypothetical protein [Verrucomicrobiota bacterium]
MNAPDFENLKLKALQGNLKPEEQEQFEKVLASDLAARSDWEAEMALDKLIQQLPSTPVSSNFTTRVLQAVRAENAPKQARPAASWFSIFHWFHLKRWLTGGAVATCILLLAWNQRQQAIRNDLAQSVVLVSDVAARLLEEPSGKPDSTLEPSDVQLLQDFDAIYGLTQAQDADVALLAVLETR